MKRYLVFGYDEYYPAGGRHDVCAKVETLAEVRKTTRTGHDSYDVLDLQERRWLDEAEWAGEK